MSIGSKGLYVKGPFDNDRLVRAVCARVRVEGCLSGGHQLAPRQLNAALHLQNQSVDCR